MTQSLVTRHGFILIELHIYICTFSYCISNCSFDLNIMQDLLPLSIVIHSQINCNQVLVDVLIILLYMFIIVVIVI